MALPSAGTTMERLQAMVHDLERMERLMHSDDSPPPTLTEHQLYGLIIWHVKLYILMYYIDRGSRFHRLTSNDKANRPSDEKEELIHILMEVYCGRHSVVTRGCLSGEQVGQKVEQLWDLLIMFNGLLKKSRSHLSKLYSPPVASSVYTEGKENRIKDSQVLISSESETNTRKDREDDASKFREGCLLGILHGLEDIGQARSYAPPGDGEIQFYQDIRKRVTSYLEFVGAKPGWQSLLRKWHSVTKEAQGMELWHSFYRGPSSYGVSYSPAGYKLGTALDEFPDFLSILKECKCHFLEIHSCLSKGEKLVKEDEKFNKGCEGKEAQASVSIGEEETKHGDSVETPSDEDKLVVARESKVNKRTREQNLQDILTVFKKMGPLKLDTQLQIGEVRLYFQVVEHVTSSIWMYNTLQGCIYGKERCEGNSDPSEEESADDVFDHSDSAMEADDELITREKCLIKMVQLVESIRSSFLGTAPTEEEIGHYKEIQTQLDADLLNLKISGIQGEVEYKSWSSVSASASMSKPLLRFVYDWELMMLKEVEEDLREMVRILYPRLLEQDRVVDPLKMVEDYFNNHKLRERAIYEIADTFLERTHGLKVLDHLILILTKLETLFDSFLCTMRNAHKHMDSLMGREMNKEIVFEVSSALEVLRLHPSSPVVCRNFWGRCQAMEASLAMASGGGNSITGRHKGSYKALDVSIPIASPYKDKNQALVYQSCVLKRSRSF